jgi:voltage-gated potassium channel
MLAFLLMIGQFLRVNTGAFRDPKVRPLAVWSAVLLLIGTVFYHNIEGWGWIDSLYFCVISLATVGYGDLHPTTDIGKIFTIFYLLTGVSILLAFVNAMFERNKETPGRWSRERQHTHDRHDGEPSC